MEFREFLGRGGPKVLVDGTIYKFQKRFDSETWIL